MCTYACQAFIVQSRSKANVECLPTKMRFAYFKEHRTDLEPVIAEIRRRDSLRSTPRPIRDGYNDGGRDGGYKDYDDRGYKDYTDKNYTDKYNDYRDRNEYYDYSDKQGGDDYRDRSK